MSAKIKLIVTADDYGVHKAVNEGIIKGIVEGSINTVTVLMNFPDSAKELKRLVKILDKKNLLRKVGLGIHLNVTTGNPILKTGVDSLINSNGNFLTFDDLKGPKINTLKVVEIKKELQAQIDLFNTTIDKTGCKVHIDHFTSQHNILHSVLKFSRVIAALSIENRKLGKYKSKPIPCRRPIPIMMELKDQDIAKDEIKAISARTKEYVVWKEIDKVKSMLYKLKRLRKSKLTMVIDEVFGANNIQLPSAMFFSFFGAKPKSGKRLVKFRSILPLLHEAAIDEGIISEDDDFYIEVVHHVGISPTKTEVEEAKKISGFDYKYFEKFRPNELELVLNSYYVNMGSNSLNSPIQFANYSDLNKVSKV